MKKTFFVLHCAETIKGGVATYINELVRYQSELYGAEKVALIVPRDQVPFIGVSKGVRVVSFRRFKNRFLNSISLLFSTFLFVIFSNVKIVHMHSTFAGAVLRPLLWVSSVSTVYCPHGWSWDRDTSSFKKAVLRRLEYLFSFLCDSIVCISDHERILAEDAGISANKLSVIKNGVADVVYSADRSPVLWPLNSGLRVLFVGRFDRQKGFDIFLDAMSSLGSRVSAVAIGEPVLDDFPVDNFPNNVCAMGWMTTSDLVRYYFAADVLVVPSRWEGFGLVAIEAMRSGLAVLAHKVGGLKEIVVEGETGVFLESNTAAEIVKVLIEYDKEEFARLGENGRRVFLERFSSDITNEKISNLYQSLTA